MSKKREAEKTGDAGKMLLFNLAAELGIELGGGQLDELYKRIVPYLLDCRLPPNEKGSQVILVVKKDAASPPQHVISGTLETIISCARP